MKKYAIEENKQKISNSYDEMDVIGKSIKDKEKELKMMAYDYQSKYEETCQHIKEEYERLSSEIESINPKIKLINDTINRFNNLSNQYTDLMQMNAHYQDEKDRVAKGKSPICAMCHQLLQSAESKQSVINSYQEKIDENMKTLVSINEEIIKLPDIQIMKRKSESLSGEYTEKSAKYRELLQDYNSYQVKIVEAQKDIESARSALNKIDDCSNQLRKKTDTRDKLRSEIKKYEYFYNLFSPTGIIINILSDAIDYINIRLSTYSSILLEKDYKINFVKGKISLVDSKGASYQSLSNGEKRRLDISIQFALHDYVSMYCGMHMDTVFIDEILDTLDDIGVENIFEILRLKLEYCHLKSIYVITHNSELKDKFDKVITVKKDSTGDSYIL